MSELQEQQAKTLAFKREGVHPRDSENPLQCSQCEVDDRPLTDGRCPECAAFHDRQADARFAAATADYGMGRIGKEEYRKAQIEWATGRSFRSGTKVAWDPYTGNVSLTNPDGLADQGAK